MLFGLRVWARGFWHGLKRPGRLRRACFTIAVFVPWWAVRGIVEVGRALDHVFYPGFRRQPIDRPLYIIGAPRSGTTFLHSLVAMDEERFTSLTLYETLLPSIVLCRLVEIGAAIDRAMGRPLGRLAAAIERSAFGGWDGIHQTAFSRHEEPEGPWVLRMLTSAIYLLFPFFDEMPELGSLEELRNERVRRSAVRFYVGTMQRHLYMDARRGNDRTLLVKTVLFPSRIDAVREAIPDIRFVYLHRDPRESVASALSMFTAPWKAHSPRMVGPTPEAAGLARVFIDGYHAYARVREETPRDRWLTLDYRRLVADPEWAVRRIYGHFDLPLHPGHASLLAEAAARARDRRSTHSYSLEGFGLTPADIEAALPEAVAEATTALGPGTA